jgi:hypothetical protein
MEKYLVETSPVCTTLHCVLKAAVKAAKIALVEANAKGGTAAIDA